MNDSNFKIISKMKYLIKYINDYVFSGFPKTYLALKINLEKCMYNIIEETLRARLNLGNIRVKHIKEILINLSLIDYYIGEVYDKKIIIYKRYCACININNEVYKMVYRWLLNEEVKKSI